MSFNKRVIIKILCFSFLFNVLSTDSSFGMEYWRSIRKTWKSVQKTVDDTTKSLGNEGVKTTKTLGVLGIGGGIFGGSCALICKGVLGNSGSVFTAKAMGVAIFAVMSGIGFLTLSKTLKWCFGKKPNYEKERNRIDEERLDLEREKFEWEKRRKKIDSDDEDGSDSSSDDEE